MKYVKRTLKLGILALATLFIFSWLSGFLVKTSYGTHINIEGFYLEPKDSLDVVLVGSSEFYTGYSAPLAYDKYGYTSYSLAFEAAPGAVYKSVAAEAIKKQHPKLLVFETNGILYSDKFMYNETSLRRWIDCMPNNINRIKTIHEIVPKNERMTYYFNILKYHSNWERIDACAGIYKAKLKMKLNGYSKMKGFSQQTTKCKDYKVTTEKKTFGAEGEKSLRNLLDYCKEQNVENVLIMRAPHIVKPNKESLDKIQQIVKEYGYDFKNFQDCKSEIGLDDKTDFYNVDHMNAIGEEKFTDYLGKYITENYDVKSEKSEKVKKQWEDCASFTKNAFVTLKEKTLQNENKRYFETTFKK